LAGAQRLSTQAFDSNTWLGAWAYRLTPAGGYATWQNWPQSQPEYIIYCLPLLYKEKLAHIHGWRIKRLYSDRKWRAKKPADQGAYNTPGLPVSGSVYLIYSAKNNEWAEGWLLPET